jgi:uncharacterized protein (DUF433 family)
MTLTRITVRPDQMDGVPCIRGLRIPVATIYRNVADAMSTDEVVDASRTSRNSEPDGSLATALTAEQ